jgi:hypothetical protein
MSLASGFKPMPYVIAWLGLMSLESHYDFPPFEKNG